VGDELLHTDGYTDRQTDMTKLVVAFRNFAKAPENYGLRIGSIPVLRLKARLMPADLGPLNITVCKALELRSTLPHRSWPYLILRTGTDSVLKTVFYF
jgi:hypothetical protein